MSGNTANTALWENADVYIAPEGTEGPNDLTSAWGAAWKPAGLLNGEEGFTEGREEETGEHYAWGGVLFKRTRSQHKRSFSFVALEDNEVTFGLVNPGSTRTATGGVRKSTIKVPKSARFAIGFELREGDKIKRRWAKAAEVSEVGEIQENETDPVVFNVTSVVFPESDGTLYHVVETDPDYVGSDPDA